MHIHQILTIKFMTNVQMIMDAIHGLMMSIELSFLSIIFIIGGIIIVTLAYVAWRKYKGQKTKHKKQIKGENK